MYILTVGFRDIETTEITQPAKHTLMKPAPSLLALFVSTIKKLPLQPAHFP